MKFDPVSYSLLNQAFEATQLLSKAYETNSLDKLTNFEEIIDTLEELINDYEYALNQLESNHIDH